MRILEDATFYYIKTTCCCKIMYCHHLELLKDELKQISRFQDIVQLKVFPSSNDILNDFGSSEPKSEDYITSWIWQWVLQNNHLSPSFTIT